MFVEGSSRHQETHAKNSPNLVIPLSISSTKGILCHPKVDWPCQDFTQGSTRNQSNIQAVKYNNSHIHILVYLLKSQSIRDSNHLLRAVSVEEVHSTRTVPVPPSSPPLRDPPDLCPGYRRHAGIYWLTTGQPLICDPSVHVQSGVHSNLPTTKGSVLFTHCPVHTEHSCPYCI